MDVDRAEIFGLNVDAEGLTNTLMDQTVASHPQTFSVPVEESKTSFWTICPKCHVKHEYTIQLLNSILFCPFCRNHFVACEILSLLQKSNQSKSVVSSDKAGLGSLQSPKFGNDNISHGVASSTVKVTQAFQSIFEHLKREYGEPSLAAFGDRISPSAPFKNVALASSSSWTSSSNFDHSRSASTNKFATKSFEHLRKEYGEPSLETFGDRISPGVPFKNVALANSSSWTSSSNFDHNKRASTDKFATESFEHLKKEYGEPSLATFGDRISPSAPFKNVALASSSNWTSSSNFDHNKSDSTDKFAPKSFEHLRKEYGEPSLETFGDRISPGAPFKNVALANSSGWTSCSNFDHNKRASTDEFATESFEHLKKEYGEPSLATFGDRISPSAPFKNVALASSSSWTSSSNFDHNKRASTDKFATESFEHLRREYKEPSLATFGDRISRGFPFEKVALANSSSWTSSFDHNKKRASTDKFATESFEHLKREYREPSLATFGDQISPGAPFTNVALANSSSWTSSSSFDQKKRASTDKFATESLIKKIHKPAGKMRFSQIKVHDGMRNLSRSQNRSILMYRARREIGQKFKEWNVSKLEEANIAHRSNKSPAVSPNIESQIADFVPVLMAVPDSDFHDFDKNRVEEVFSDNQLWAIYDDDDGMPRIYAIINKVISLKPFKIEISWLISKGNEEFGPMDWVRHGFRKTSGIFRKGKREVYDSLSAFSHMVKWRKGIRGVIQFYPRKGDVWALYRNWSPDWNVFTPNDVTHTYDVVEVLEDYDEERGIIVAPLVKVCGFKTVFQKHLDARKTRTLSKEEMFRFSHQVPSFVLTGEEGPNAPKGCWELDPAALPMELLEVSTQAQEEEVQNSGHQFKDQSSTCCRDDNTVFRGSQKEKGLLVYQRRGKKTKAG